MTSNVELFNEMVKCHKKMLDILENDRQKHQTTIALESSQIVNNQPNQEQVESLQTFQKSQSKKIESRVYPNQTRDSKMTPQVVNSKPNPTQVPSSQKEKVCSDIEVIDTDDEDQETSAILIRSKSIAVERKKRDFRQLEENIRENVLDETNELRLQNVKKKRADDDNASMPRTSQSLELQKSPRLAVRSYQKQMAIQSRKDNSNLFELIECGRYIGQSKNMFRMIIMLLSRFSMIEKPNGGSFYNLIHGIYIQKNGNCVQIARCYGHYLHNCQVKLKIDYKRDDSLYKLYTCGTHNHGLNHYKTEKSKKRDTFESDKFEIISSKIADYVKENMTQ